MRRVVWEWGVWLFLKRWGGLPEMVMTARHTSVGVVSSTSPLAHTTLSLSFVRTLIARRGGPQTGPPPAEQGSFLSPGCKNLVGGSHAH